MKIALLAHGLHAAGGKSVGVNVLAASARMRPEYDYLSVVPSQDDYMSIRFPTNAEVLPYRLNGPLHRIYFDTIQLRARVVAFRPDLVWGLGNMGLVRPPCRQAILLHKPQLVYPSNQRPIETICQRVIDRLTQTQFKRSLRRTQIVFCQTEVMRRRFRENFCFKGQVELMPNAVSRIVTEMVDDDAPPELATISRKFKLFTLTRYYAHKNLELIVECFDRFRDEMADVACVLTIAKSQHPGARRLLNTIRARGLQDAIVNVGPLPQDRLGSFYRHTDGLLLPTLLESFSGTYLEAMAFERPIITSDLDFAREVCGNAAIYFDPWVPFSLMLAIRQLREEKEISVRLAQAGQMQRTKFECDWDQIVDSAMKAIESCVKQ